MASLAVIGSHSVNGVSALHSEILKNDLFHDFYLEEPQKFTNVTNGIAHRRWLNQSNPELAKLITQLVGKDYIYDADKLQGLLKYQDDAQVLEQLRKIKRGNKERLAAYLKKTQGRRGGPRLHLRRASQAPPRVQAPAHERPEHLATYQWLRENPNADFTPTPTCSAPSRGGVLLRQADHPGSSPPWPSRSTLTPGEQEAEGGLCRELLRHLGRAPHPRRGDQRADLPGRHRGLWHQQHEVYDQRRRDPGHLDGANVEIHEAVGDDNILLFGMTASQVEELKRTGYNPALQYQNDPVIHRAMNELNSGIGGQQFRDIFQALTTKDQYMALADLGSYRAAQQKAQDLYRDQGRWNRMSW